MRVRRMQDDVREYLVHDHPAEIQERLKAKIGEAESKGLARYYLVGNDFYYLIDNGQIRGNGKGSKAKIMRHISDAMDDIGPTEVFEV